MTFQLKLALRYLRGRKLRTTLTLIAITFGVTIVFGFNGILPAMQQALQTNLSAAVDQVDLTITSQARGAFDANVTEQVRQTPGVALAAPSLARPLLVPTAEAITAADGTAITSFILRGVLPEQLTDLNPVSLAAGRPLIAADENSVLISNNLAQETGLRVGDTLKLPSATGLMTFEIVGITMGRPPMGSEELIVPLAAAQTVFNLPGLANTIEARFDAGINPETVRQDILARLGSGYKVGGNETGSEFAAALNSAKYVMNLFGVIAAAMGGFIIFITFRTVVVERRRDIGMLRIIGASRRTILGMILAECLLLGSIGTVLGILLGFFMAYGLLVGMQPIMENMMHARLGTPAFAPWVYVVAVVLGLGLTVLAGLVPALAATRVSPLDALRPSLAEVERRSAGRSAIAGIVVVIIAFLTLIGGNVGLASLGILLFMIGLVLIGPALIYPIARTFGSLLRLIFAREGQIAQGNLTRQPGRAAITASAITIGLSLLVAMGGLITSLMGGLNGWIDKTLGSDYLYMPQSLVLGGGNIGAGPRLVEEIKTIPGVSEVTTLRQTTARIDGTDLQIVGIDPVTYPQVSGLIFSAGDEATIYDRLASGREIVVNGIFAAQAGVKLGDTLPLQSPEGVLEYHVAGIGGDFMNYKIATGYVSQENMARDFHATTDLLLMVNQQDNANTAQVDGALRTLARDYPAFGFYSLTEWKTEIGTMLEVFNAMYVLLIVLAIPSLIALINTLAINVLERTREIGTLRAVGATRRQVRRMITAESLLLAATGTLFGLLAGLWLSYILVGAMNFVGLVFPFAFSYAGLLLAIAVGIGFGIIGAIIPARQAAKLDIVRALAYE
ncbi:MAG: ABC transporter permease [Anaerolineales bacterium]|nr:ABC transporter permease [Anaerolineales bacterium]MCB8951356.1 ABC transporter permease [Ardenticatenales bacterium]